MARILAGAALGALVPLFDNVLVGVLFLLATCAAWELAIRLPPLR